MSRVRKAAVELARQLLLLDAVNRLVFATRFFWFVRVRRRVRVHEDELGVVAHRYSVRMLEKGKTSNRPLRLIRPLAALDQLPKKSARVLSVGCRFETELLYLVAHGFSPKNVRGLDMVSYSPWVDAGNMHDMPYDDDSWDAVVLGWVLPYSDKPEQAVAEVVRVCRDGGIVAIGLSYYPPETLAALEEAGTIVGSATERNQTVDGVLALFGETVGDVFFRHDAADPAAEGVCLVIFSVDKGKGKRKSKTKEAAGR